MHDVLPGDQAPSQSQGAGAEEPVGRTEPPVSEPRGVAVLKQALEVLQEEAVAQPSRELSLAITKAEEALMWRCQAP